MVSRLTQVLAAGELSRLLESDTNGGADAADPRRRLIDTVQLSNLGVDDYTWPNPGDVSIYGTDVENVITSNSGNDVLFGRDDDDTMYGMDGNDQLNGEEGDDTLFGGDGDDYIYGNEGADTLHGEDGDDHLFGGNPTAPFGGTGNNRIYGGNGDDDVEGGPDADIIYGGDGYDGNESDNDGNDNLFGGFGTGQDRLFGGSGDDVLYGYIGALRQGGFSDPTNDYLYGGDGDDEIIAARGDTVIPGTGLNEVEIDDFLNPDTPTIIQIDRDVIANARGSLHDLTTVIGFKPGQDIVALGVAEHDVMWEQVDGNSAAVHLVKSNKEQTFLLLEACGTTCWLDAQSNAQYGDPLVADGPDEEFFVAVIVIAVVAFILGIGFVCVGMAYGISVDDPNTPVGFVDRRPAGNPLKGSIPSAEEQTDPRQNDLQIGIMTIQDQGPPTEPRRSAAIELMEQKSPVQAEETVPEVVPTRTRQTSLEKAWNEKPPTPAQ